MQRQGTGWRNAAHALNREGSLEGLVRMVAPEIVTQVRSCMLTHLGQPARRETEQSFAQHTTSFPRLPVQLGALHEVRHLFTKLSAPLCCCWKVYV